MVSEHSGDGRNDLLVFMFYFVRNDIVKFSQRIQLKRNFYAQRLNMNLFIETVTTQRHNEITFVSSGSTLLIIRLFMKPSARKYT
jgi:hypothetical protein